VRDSLRHPPLSTDKAVLKGFPDLPPVWLLLALVLVWVLGTYLPLVRLFGPVWQAAGILAAVSGFALIGWAALWFWRKRTTIEPHHDPSALIVEGPYRLSRNPIYLGLLAILAGAVLWQGALSPLPVPFAFAAILTRRFIEPEESALRRAFGAEAERYLGATRRWL
jgi:protein-S-isoprenylcysteine O-methyltransferase Ste14